MKILLTDKCEYAKECPFYEYSLCDKYYQSELSCGIKREVDSGKLWEWIKLNHHKANQ